MEGPCWKEQQYPDHLDPSVGFKPNSLITRKFAGNFAESGLRESEERAGDSLVAFSLIGALVRIAEVKFLAQPMPRASHRNELRLVFGRIYDLGKPKVVFSLRTKPMRHRMFPDPG